MPGSNGKYPAHVHRPSLDFFDLEGYAEVGDAEILVGSKDGPFTCHDSAHDAILFERAIQIHVG